MGAGALYFFLLRSDVDPAYRSAMVVAGLVCAIACFHYSKMTAVYQAGGQFPTALRYIDWLFTTPLLLVKFPLLLRMGDRGAKFFWQLVILDVAMIVTAFIAETSPVDSQRWWTFFLVSCAIELLIVGVLYLQLGQAIGEAPAPLAKALETMRLFVLIGWAIYPIGSLGVPDDAAGRRGLMWPRLVNADRAAPVACVTGVRGATPRRRRSGDVAADLSLGRAGPGLARLRCHHGGCDRRLPDRARRHDHGIRAAQCLALRSGSRQRTARSRR